MKSDFDVRPISKGMAKSIIEAHHYLGKIYDEHDGVVRDYKYYGLFNGDDLIGAVQYTSYCQKRCGEEWCRFYYGCEDFDYSNYYELSRLAVDSKEYNITSWFVSRTMKMIGADYICTSVDSRMHDGTIYSACNMNFHGSMFQRANGYMDIPFNVFSKIYRKDIKQDWEIKDLTNTN